MTEAANVERDVHTGGVGIARGIAVPSASGSSSQAGLPLLLDTLDPSGCVVVALPGDDRARSMAMALLARGFPEEHIDELPAAEMNRWLRAVVLHAGRAPNLAAEIRELRDFYIGAMEGCSWLVVRAPDAVREAQILEEAQRAGARSTRTYATAQLARH
jgi:hypothetical protein